MINDSSYLYLEPEPFDDIKLNSPTLVDKLDKLYHKYNKLQNLYYSVYIDSFNDYAFDEVAWQFIKLSNSFKGICRLLIQVKNLILNQTSQKLGYEDLKVLLSYKDVKKFMDQNNHLYPIIDSNYEFFV
jgi:hypothetical protein